jgi:hypothetical protein
MTLYMDYFYCFEELKEEEGNVYAWWNSRLNRTTWNIELFDEFILLDDPKVLVSDNRILQILKDHTQSKVALYELNKEQYHSLLLETKEITPYKTRLENNPDAHRDHNLDIRLTNSEAMLSRYQDWFMLEDFDIPEMDLEQSPETVQDSALLRFKDECERRKLQKNKTIPRNMLREIMSSIGEFSGTKDEFTTQCAAYKKGREYASRLRYSQKGSAIYNI